MRTVQSARHHFGSNNVWPDQTIPANHGIYPPSAPPSCLRLLKNMSQTGCNQSKSTKRSAPEDHVRRVPKVGMETLKRKHIPRLHCRKTMPNDQDQLLHSLQLQPRHRRQWIFSLGLHSTASLGITQCMLHSGRMTGSSISGAGSAVAAK